MRLKNKIALVTGSTTGIGEAIARRFASEGAHVMLHGRRADEGEKVVREINTAGKGEAAFFEGALEKPEVCDQLVAATVKQFGGIDILVNNAATTQRSNLDSTDAATFDHIMAINVRAPMLLIRAARPHFLKRGGGRVLNIGSINAYTGEPNLLGYSMSKGALMTLSRNLADSLATEQIRVNHFNVGWVLTKNEYELKLREGHPKDWPEKLPAVFAPSGRIQTPAEIADFALFFCSDEAGVVSGAVVELEQYPMIGRNPNK